MIPYFCFIKKAFLVLYISLIIKILSIYYRFHNECYWPVFWPFVICVTILWFNNFRNSIENHSCKYKTIFLVLQKGQKEFWDYHSKHAAVSMYMETNHIQTIKAKDAEHLWLASFDFLFSTEKWSYDLPRYPWHDWYQWTGREQESERFLLCLRDSDVNPIPSTTINPKITVHGKNHK